MEQVVPGQVSFTTQIESGPCLRLLAWGFNQTLRASVRHADARFRKGWPPVDSASRRRIRPERLGDSRALPVRFPAGGSGGQATERMHFGPSWRALLTQLLTGTASISCAG